MIGSFIRYTNIFNVCIEIANWIYFSPYNDRFAGKYINKYAYLKCIERTLH